MGESWPDGQTFEEFLEKQGGECGVCEANKLIHRCLTLTDGDGVVIDRRQFCADCWRGEKGEICCVTALRDKESRGDERKRSTHTHKMTRVKNQFSHYLGDAVYADWDGCELCLTTRNGTRITNNIFLSDDLITRLIEFIERTQK